LRCEGFDKLIHLFLDGRLDQAKERELKEHLSECEICARKLALLESLEGGAKRIEIKEPTQEYWNTFSSRVREKIIEREEKSFAFGLRKALQSIFSFSPLKIKVAAGLISVVLVFIIGKLYVDYRGHEVVPSKKVIRTEEQPQFEIMDFKKEKGFPTPETKQRAPSISEKPKMKKEVAPVGEPERKDLPEEDITGEKEVVSKEEKPPAQPQVAEEAPTRSELLNHL